MPTPATDELTQRADAESVDLRSDPLARVRAVDFRSPARDFLADEALLWGRLRAVLAGLDDSAWQLPGAARSDAGGPDWSLQDHVGHLVDWHEMAAGYVAGVLDGGAWPNDDDYDGGDFDRFNEGRRDLWATIPPARLRARMVDARARFLPLLARLPMDTIRSNEAWGWVYMVLHGHALDHLAVLEPWAASLRRRQIEGDPFLPDPRPAGDGSPDAIARFWAAEASAFGQFDELVRPVAPDRWERRGPTPDWTLKDHVGHLARWFEEGADVIEEHRRTGHWRAGPADGLDAWNARQVEAARSLTAARALERFEAGHARLQEAARSMAPAELASPEAGYWTYECLHGHVRAHLAMVGPWCVGEVE